MVINSNSINMQSYGNYQNYMQTQVVNVNAKESVKTLENAGVTLELSAQSKALSEQMNKDSFGSVNVKASSSVMNVVLTDLQGTVSSAGSKAHLDEAF